MYLPSISLCILFFKLIFRTHARLCVHVHTCVCVYVSVPCLRAYARVFVYVCVRVRERVHVRKSARAGSVAAVQVGAGEGVAAGGGAGGRRRPVRTSHPSRAVLSSPGCGRVVGRHRGSPRPLLDKQQRERRVTPLPRPET